jgi:hypothetical protein
MNSLDLVEQTPKMALELHQILGSAHDIVVRAFRGQGPDGDIIAEHGPKPIVGDGRAERQLERDNMRALPWVKIHHSTVSDSNFFPPITAVVTFSPQDISRTSLGHPAAISGVVSGNGRIGAPDMIRTCGLRLRRATLYPPELRVHPGNITTPDDR